MANSNLNKELTLTACLRPQYVDNLSRHPEYTNLLVQMLKKVLRAKYHSISEDFKLHLVAVNEDDQITIANLHDDTTLMNSEILVSKYIQGVYASSMEYISIPINEFNLSDQLEKLSINGRHSIAKLKKEHHYKLSECNMIIHLFYNLDQLALSPLDINIEDGYDEEWISQLLIRDPGLSHFPDFLQTFSKETFDTSLITSLPNSNLGSNWDSTFIEPDLENEIFRICKMNMKLTNLMNDMNISSSSSSSLCGAKLILLTGPPGNGKTTICKTISHKLMTESMKLTKCKGLLIELDCSRIFSKWFGESSLKISKFFNDIEKLLSSFDKEILVFLLIDEVETLATSRSKLIDQNESADGVRVVNTLLTHLDRFKKFKNIIIFATSNLIESIDPAFIDRCDSIFKFGNPSIEIIFQILRSTINQFINLKIIVNDDLIRNYDWCVLHHGSKTENPSCILFRICGKLKQQDRSSRYVSKIAVTALIGQQNDALKKPITVYLANLISLL